MAAPPREGPCAVTTPGHVTPHREVGLTMPFWLLGQAVGQKRGPVSFILFPFLFSFIKSQKIIQPSKIHVNL
jgi:hypothetical protein